MKTYGLSESQKLRNNLFDIASKIYSFPNKIKGSSPFEEYDVKENIEFSKQNLSDLQVLHKTFNDLFFQLYTKSLQENFFWQYCPMDVYKLYFEVRLKQKQQEYPDLTQKQFAENEMDILLSNIEDGYWFSASSVSDFLSSENTLNLSFLLDFLLYTLLERKLKMSFLNSENVNRIYLSQKRKIDFLQTKLFTEPSNNTLFSENHNPYPSIFKDYNSYLLFKEFLMEGNKKFYIRETSFIYWKMCNCTSPLIHSHIKPSNFRTWFNDEFHKEVQDWDFLMETKTFSESKTPEREKRYHRIKNSIFKSNST